MNAKGKMKNLILKTAAKAVVNAAKSEADPDWPPKSPILYYQPKRPEPMKKDAE